MPTALSVMFFLLVEIDVEIFVLFHSDQLLTFKITLMWGEKWEIVFVESKIILLVVFTMLFLL